jgi:hypothetical protein
MPGQQGVKVGDTEDAPAAPDVDEDDEDEVG